MGIYGTHTQIGYRGAGGGGIGVFTTGDLSLSIYNGGTVQIGNGAAFGSIGGDVTGDIRIEVGGTLNLTQDTGTIVLGNRATAGHVETGDFSLHAADRSETGNALNDSILGDIVGGDVSITIDSALLGIGPLSYASDHKLSLSTGGTLQVDHDITNTGLGVLALSAGSDITQSGVISVHSLTATSTGGSIDLSNGANVVASASFSASGDVLFGDNADLTLEDITAGGRIYVSAAGDLSVDGQLSASGSEDCGVTACIDLEANGALSETADGALLGESLYASSNNADVTLDNTQNAITGAVHLYSYDGNVTFVDSSGFTMEDGQADGTFSITSVNGGIDLDNTITAGDTLAITAHDDITESEDADLEAGGLAATSSDGNVMLFDGYNDITGTVTLSAHGDAWLFNDDDTDIGESTIGGQLYVESTGDVTQSGAISAGSLAVQAGDFGCGPDCGGNVTLTNTGNTIAGDVVFLALGDVNFTDAVGFNLGSFVFQDVEYENIDHTLIGGELTATALTGGITINAGVETGLNGGCGCDPTLTAAGDITETADGYITGFDLNVTSTGGRIVLLGDNDLVGTVSFQSAGDALFYNDTDTNLGASTVDGTLFVSSLGNVTQSGALSATNLVVEAIASDCGCSKGDVLLDNAANAISGKVAFEADGDVTFKNTSSFTFHDITIEDVDNTFSTQIGGGLTATSLSGGITIDGGVSADFGSDPTLIAAGDIVETANGYITGGNLTVTSLGGGIALNSTDNHLSGVVSLNAHTDASFATGYNVLLGASNVAGDLTVLAQGDIDIVSSIQNAGSGAITLVAGWDGQEAIDFSIPGTYGLDGGSVNLGGETADNVFVGSAHGTTHVYAASLNFNAGPTDVQLGYHGAGGGDIFVNVTQNINGIGSNSGSHSLQLGNGTLTNDVAGDVTGNIVLDAGGQIVFFSQQGAGWLGNHAAAGYGEAGDVTAVSVTGSYSADYMQADLGTSAGTGGNLFIGFRDNAELEGFRIGGIEYNSPHRLVFANAGSLDVLGGVINHGTGEVTLVAGWDGHTIGGAAQLKAAHAYGLNNAVMNVGGNHHYESFGGFDNNQFENVSVGSAGGLTAILTGDLKIAPAAGYYAQIGTHGSTGGAIDVEATGNLSMQGGTATHDYAMIGNGSLNGDVTGNITGNIDIRVAGSSSLVTAPGNAKAWIGNYAAPGYSETGNVFFQTGDFENADGLGAMAASALSGGDVTLAVTNSGGEIDDPILYNSSHNLTLLIAGGLTVANAIQNGGNGAITVVTGWNGTTFDAAHFGDAGVYGNNSGSLLIGGANAAAGSLVGSHGGATSVYAANVTLSALHGLAQLGYHGGGSGAVNVTALNSVSLFTGANNLVAQIGNGGTDVSGTVGGAVNVSSQNGVFLTAAYQGSAAAIGNVGGPNASESGNVTVNTHGAALTLTASAGAANTHIGNWTKGAANGTTSGNITIDGGAISLISTGGGTNLIGNGLLQLATPTSSVSGNILIHAASFLASADTGFGQSRVGNLGIGAVSGNTSIFTTGDFTLTGDHGLVNIGNVSAEQDADGNPVQSPVTGNLLVQSGGKVTLTASNGGNARIEMGGTVNGTVTVSAVGDIVLSTGAPGGNGTGSLAYIGTLLSGNGGANILVTSTGGKIELDANEAGSRVQIGNSQNGTQSGALTGTVTVSATNASNGNIILTATGASSRSQIGNSADSGETVGGDVSVVAGNVLNFGAGNVLIGNRNSNPQGDGTVPAPFTGNVTLSAFSVAGNMAPSLVNDLSGGDVLVKVFGPSFTFGGALAYNSSHVLSVLAAGNIAVANSVQNAGAGAINLVAGWNGTTTNAAHFFDAGAFGNNNGSILIGGAGAAGDVAVGSAGGPTLLGAKDITLAGVNGYAQLGYHGAAGGLLGLNALGAVSLSGGANAALYAQIGNGTTFGSNAAGGDVSIASASIADSANGAVTGATLKLAANSGNIGASATALRIASSSLQLTTNGGSVFLTSPNGGVSFGGTGVNLGGGNLTLAAAGAITQTAAIHTAQTSLTTTSGDITLTNADNGFGGLTIATPGSATLTHSSLLTIASANIGGTLTLNAGTAINQSGAIVAASLNASAANGTIVLSNAGNSFGTLALTTAAGNDATVADSTAVVLAGATVGGKLTLSAGGAITQSAAIHTGQLSLATTAGDITLSNSGNTFGGATIATPGNATLAHASLLSIAGANVGGTLTLNAGTAISQQGAIVAASLNASAANGTIVLGNVGNSFATLTLHTAAGFDAAVADSTAVVLAGATVGGKLSLTAGGAVSQSGAIAANGLSVSTASGAITLASAANAVSQQVALNSAGALTFANSLNTTFGVLGAGGDVTLLSKGGITFLSPLQLNTSNITAVAGWDGTSTSGFGNSGVYGNSNAGILIGGPNAAGNVAVGSKSGTTSLYAANVILGGAHGYAQLGYHGAGGGTILVRALHDLTLNGLTGYAMVGNGSLNNDVTGNVTGDIDVQIGGTAYFNGGGANALTWFGNVAHSGSETGNVIFVGTDTDGTQDLGDFVAADLAGGDVTVGLTGTNDHKADTQVTYNSSHTLNILTAGNFIISGAIQNAGSGAINLVAGWDGHTLSAASYGNAGVYGNNGKGVLIGGASATGNAAFGSAGGQTSVYGAALALQAVNGYAQLGFNGHGSGAILVKVLNGVSLTGGGSAGRFAQIGNGGLGTSGNNSGAITISAGGDLTMTGGAGSEAYVQVGHGGAESNTGANGYSNVAPITVTAANVVLNAGAGTAAYVQIGNGGYKAGLNLAGGTALNGGDITITSGHAVSLQGNGADAYAMIGNGGGLSNFNAAASAGGTDSGNIVVHAPNGAAGAVTLAAGAGADSFVQIGNGGYGANSGPTTTAANFFITGDVSVTDLALSGGNSGPNSYAQIGNGDASHNSVANVSGNITIDANGQITYTTGTALHSQATIGNFTGLGTVSGQVSGAVPAPPPEIVNDPAVIGVVVNNTANNGSNNHNPITTIQTYVIPDQQGGGTGAANVQAYTPGPLATLEGDGDDKNDSDHATVVIADSLDGAKKAGSQSLLGGMLKASAGGTTAFHAVPPADQDFSSWGNEALWQ